MSKEHTPLTRLVVATAELAGGICDLKTSGRLKLDRAANVAIRMLLAEALEAVNVALDAMEKESADDATTVPQG